MLDINIIQKRLKDYKQNFIPSVARPISQGEMIETLDIMLNLADLLQKRDQEKVTIGVYLSEEDGILPNLVYGSDVGYDIRAIEDIIVPVGCVRLVRTGVHLAMPKNIFAQVNTRSSYGKRGISLHHGVIDSGYTGEISIWVMNIAKPVDDQGLQLTAPFIIKKGDKIGQLLFHKAERVNMKQINELPQTKRGDKGHGSSGR